MRLLAAALILGSLAACGQQTAASKDSGPGPEATSSAMGPGGRIIDLANVLDPAAEASLQRKIDGRRPGARPVMVILIEQGEGESLEQFGWAVSRRDPSGAGPFLLLLDTASRAARLEGDLPPERKAVVVRAMAPALRSGNYASAVSSGLSELERLAP